MYIKANHTTLTADTNRMPAPHDLACRPLMPIAPPAWIAPTPLERFAIKPTPFFPSQLNFSNTAALQHHHPTGSPSQIDPMTPGQPSCMPTSKSPFSENGDSSIPPRRR